MTVFCWDFTGTLYPIPRPICLLALFEREICQDMLETLSPLTQLAPGEMLEHVEQWSLHKVSALGKDEASIEEALRFQVQLW